MTEKETQKIAMIEEELLALVQADRQPEPLAVTQISDDVSQEMKALARILAVHSVWSWVGLLDKE